jgi:AraC-like DNA-binding protein
MSEPTQDNSTPSNVSEHNTTQLTAQPTDATTYPIMSSNQETSKDIALREAIMELMLSPERLTHNAMAQRLNISRSTLERHIKAWFCSEGFVSWLKEEWLRLHQIVLKTDPALAYTTLASLIRHGAVEIDIASTQSDSMVRIVFDMTGPQESSKICDTQQ